MKLQTKKRLKTLKRIACILFGNLCVAVGTVFFIVPAGFMGGGVTGLALAMNAFFGLPIAVGIAILSVALLAVGAIFLGRSFVVGSALSAISYPAFVWLCELVARYVPFRTESVAINLAASVLLLGYGIALVMRQGASSGGLDTISMILNQKKGIPVAPTVKFFEILSLLTQVYYSTAEGIMGGILLTIFFTAVMNHLMTQGVARIQVLVYTEHYEEIKKFLDQKLDRGCTLFHVQGGYSGKETFALQAIIHNRQLFPLKEAVREIDPLAFVIVSEVSEVSGRGFGIEKNAPHPTAPDAQAPIRETTPPAEP